MRYLHTMVRVSDLDAALDFYCVKLGLKEIRRLENEKGRFTLVFLAAPEDDDRVGANSPMVELTWNWDAENYGGGRNFGHLAYAVKDIYALCDRLMAAGVIINRPPRDGHMAFIRSPDGISIELLQDGERLPPKEPWVSMANTEAGEGMNFASDNAYGALPEIWAALQAADRGTAPAYGNDAITKNLKTRFAELFECEVTVFPVLTGTAANALALACLTPPYGAVLCHRDSHIMTSECGAPEFFSGAKLIGLDGADGKLAPDSIAEALDGLDGSVHSVQPSAVSLSQASELGTVYSCAELSAIGKLVHGRGLKLHMDGARFANAMAHLGCTPAEATWKCGVDVLSFGATKAGALAAEAVVFFDAALARDFEYRRKRGGHLASKMRFVSAQIEAVLNNDLWRTSAARANALATRLAEGLKGIADIEIAAPVQTNMVFAWMTTQKAARIRAGGAAFHDWIPARNGKVMARLATAFATPDEDVAKLIALAKS